MEFKLVIIFLFLVSFSLSIGSANADQYKYSGYICYWCFGSDSWECPSHSGWYPVAMINPYGGGNDGKCGCPTGLYDSPSLIGYSDHTSTYYCKYMACTPSEEICNNKDDDCDGQIDEGLTQSCGSGIGECKKGEQTCSNGQWGGCIGSVGPKPETCDLKDNDCDGITDEGFDQDCDDITTCGGDCNDSNDNIHPGAPDICNGIDDDCDGSIDEYDLSEPLYFTWKVTGIGTESWADYQYKYSSSICYWCFGSDSWICPSHSGWTVTEMIRLPYPSSDDDYSCCCPAGLYDSYPGVVENCDDTTAFYCIYRNELSSGSEQRTKKDSDSGYTSLDDGIKDMGAFDAYPRPERGGVISGVEYSLTDNNAGVKTWTSNNHVYACVDYNMDDVCDTSTPEMWKCGTDVGECVSGVMVCSSGNWICEGSYVRPSEEICDGKDNDCDGLVDEDVKNACGGCGSVPEEVCDGKDNDCDGSIDDGLDNCDSDGDSIANGADNCIGIFNPDQLNSDTRFVDVGRLDYNVSADFVPGEILVKFREDDNLVGISSLSDSMLSNSVGIANQKYDVLSKEKIILGLEEHPGLRNIYKYSFPENVNITEIIREYLLDPSVEFAEPNYIYYSLETPNDAYFTRQWAHRNIESQKGWDIERGSSDVLIAIVDTGVDYTHPDLASNIYSRGMDFYSGDNDAMDENGHGTHSAGIAAAVTNNGIGVAGTCWFCKILPVRFLGPSGSGTVEAAAAAVIYAADSGADVISNSWGGYGYSSILHSAIKYAYNKGIVIVAAAGNDNTAIPLIPAGYDEVIAVAATDSSDKKASFSNYGSWVGVSAPGVGILSTYRGGYASLSGTSMATPYVAGLAGLIKSGNPSLTRDEIKQKVLSSADPLDSLYPIGEGRINLFNALKGIVSPAPETFTWIITGTGTEIWWECPTEMTATRSVTDSGSGSVSISEQIKAMGEFDAEPRPQMGGLVFNVQYTLRDNNEKVMTWIDGKHVYACLDSDSDNTCDYVSAMGTEEPKSNFKIEGGDLCDICPADANDNCDVQLAGAYSVDANGGVVSNSKNTVEIHIPPAALQNATSIAITPENIPDSGSIEKLDPIGYGYHLTPDGKKFNKPVSLSLSYGELNPAGEDSLGILSFDGENWAIQNSVVDKENDILTANITHFSIFVIAHAIRGDVGFNCNINIFDLASVGLAFGARPGDSSWNSRADVTLDGKIDILDLATVGLNYGRSC